MVFVDLQSLHGHKGDVHSVVLWNNGLLSCSEDGTARFWDLRLKRSVRMFGKIGGSEMTSVGGTRNGNTVFTSSGNTVSQFDFRGAAVITPNADCRLPDNHDEINQICLHSNDVYLAACDDAGEVQVVDVNTGKSFKTLTRQHSNIAASVCFRSKKPWEVISGGLDNSILVWDFSRGKVLFRFEVLGITPSEQSNTLQMCNPPMVHGLAVAADDVLLCAALGDGSVGVFDLKSKKEIQRLTRHTYSVSCVCWTQPNVCVSGGNDCRVCVWNTARMQLMQCVEVGHKANAVTGGGQVCYVALQDGCIGSMDFGA